MFKMLVDTCVWLDLAKDPQQQVLLSVIEELIQMHELELIVPTIILDEFKNNKVRIIEESSRSLSSHFKRVKDAVDKFGDPKKKQDILFQLNDVDHKIPLVGASTASSAVSRIEKLLRSSPIEITNDVKLRAAQRAIDQKAPFHRKKNSINDALLIESYSDFVLNKNSVGIRFAFVTHNTQDFSNPTESNKLPHPDIAVLFSKRKSLYFISFAEAIHRVQPDLVPDIMLEHDE
jgi:hypothetical protein